MAETDLTESIKATALAAMLDSARTPPEYSLYRGVLTPRQLDAPGTEIEAMAFGAAVHDLGWMRRVAVRGEDRFRWLSGMVTNTVNDLLPNTGAWNLVLNAQGRIQGDLTVWREGEELSPPRRKVTTPSSKDGDPMLGTPFAGESGLQLEISTDLFDRLLAHLNQFIIMDDVELVPQGAESAGDAGAETAIGLTGPRANEVLGRLGLPELLLPMTGTRVEWNGMDLRILRGYGVLAPHYELWLPAFGLKHLWSEKGTGTRINLHAFTDDEEEARTIVEEIQFARVTKRATWGQYAILFRTNQQSRPIETALRAGAGVSYRRRYPALWSGHRRARSAPGDFADQSIAFQQRLLPGPGDRGKNSLPWQRAPPSAPP